MKRLFLIVPFLFFTDCSIGIVDDAVVERREKAKTFVGKEWNVLDIRWAGNAFILVLDSAGERRNLTPCTEIQKSILKGEKIVFTYNDKPSQTVGEACFLDTQIIK